jgi:plasmid stabilization system protein ParE
MRAVLQHEAARRDLVKHFVYLAENADMAVADRFLENAKASFNQLAKRPFIGSPLQFQNPAHWHPQVARKRVRQISYLLLPRAGQHSHHSGFTFSVGLVANHGTGTINSIKP